MPRLRQLECVLLESMTAFVPPPSLRSLDLDLCVHLHDGAPARVPGLREFLHAAVAQLEDLVFRYGRGSWADDPEVVDLVRCLGGAGATSAALRSLAFESGHGHGAILVPLAGILGRLPHLNSLDIGCVPSVQFLEALDGTVMKDLAVLNVDLFLLGSCEHCWVHNAEVQRVMRAYPLLHIGVRYVRNTECCQCSYCNMACHALPPKGSCIIFSHPQGATSCKVSHKLAVGTDQPRAEVCFNLV